MLENNPMGTRRRRRFYHRAGVVRLPYEEMREYVEVPTDFFSDDPESDLDSEEDKTSASIVSVSRLLRRLLDIVNKMIALAEAEDQDTEEKGDDYNDGTSKSEDEAMFESEVEAETEYEGAQSEIEVEAMSER